MEDHLGVCMVFFVCIVFFVSAYMCVWCMYMCVYMMYVRQCLYGVRKQGCVCLVWSLRFCVAFKSKFSGALKEHTSYIIFICKNNLNLSINSSLFQY